MGRVFVSASHGAIDSGYRNPETTRAAAQEMVLIQHLVVQQLRSLRPTLATYEVVSVPEDLTPPQAVDWINGRAQAGDVALVLSAGVARGAALFYIAYNEQRKIQAEQFMQTYLRRVPQMLSRGAKPDTQTEVGSLAFCRQVVVPALVMEMGLFSHPEDYQLIQNQRQEVALGIAEGLAVWSQAAAAAPASSLAPYLSVDINLNGVFYFQEGMIADGNFYIPIDLVEQLGVELPFGPQIRRISYRNLVYVRAVDLRDLGLSVTSDKSTNTIVLRSTLLNLDQLDRIMGRGSASEVQLMMFLKSHNPESLIQFSELPKLYREEANTEGVNYDLAFAQMCIETNFLRFGGSVKPEQNNFAGLGGSSSDLLGANFSSPRIGVRAQIQHLKAYASSEPTVQAIVDPRFQFVRRGIAPMLAQLSGRWSPDPEYGSRIKSILRLLYESAGFL